MKKIVLIGGGSRNWSPGIVRDMMLQPALKEAQYVIHDPDKEASRLVAGVLELTRAQLAPDAKVVVQPDVEKAFSGADAFLITISTGGLEAMAHDLAIPEAFGIHHTVGDTSGPGGWARALRNIPVFAGLAEKFNRFAPQAPVLNYTNPMTVLTGVLARLCQGPVIGLCHGLFENLEFFRKLYCLPPSSEISARYAGLNHFFWMLDVRSEDRDILADLKKQLRRKTVSELLKESIEDPMGHRSEREVANELYRATGVFPYLGDRHTCEFFPQYITNKKALKAYRLRRTSIRDRARLLKNREAQLHGWLRTGLPEGHLKKSRETAADILSAWFSGTPFIDVGNVPNIGQIANLPRGLVVETPVLVDRNGFTPIAMGDLPREVLPLVEPWGHVFSETLEAGLAGDRRRALQALRLDPTVGKLTTAEVNELGGQLWQANAGCKLS